MDILIFLAVAVFGLMVGILSGVFGIGGGTVMIPVLNLIFQVPVLSSTATSLFVIAPTSISGTIRSFRQGSIDIKTALIIGISGATTSIISSYLSDALPEIVITISAAAVIFYSAIHMIRIAVKSPKNNESSGRPSKGIFKTKRGLIAAQICLGLFAGFVAGIVGVGGGFIIVPFCIAYFGFEFRQATSASLLAIAIIAVPGIVTHAILGHIEYIYGIALMLGSIPGANLGVRLLSKIPERIARILFGVMLVFSGVMLIVRSVI